MTRTQLVTERYWELQGLRGLLIGGAFTTAFGGALLSGPPPPGDALPYPWAFVSAFAILIPGMLWLDRYYANTFGRLTPTRKGRRFGTIIYPGVQFVLLFAGRELGAGMAPFFIGVAVFGAWIVVRDWPFRRHQLLMVAAGLLGALVHSSAAAVAQAEALAAGFVVFGAAAAMTGSLDHQLLASTMKGAAREEQVVDRDAV